MKKDLEKFENDNIGGVNSFKFIEAKHIVSMHQPLGGAIHTAPQLAAGSAWREAYCTLGTMYLKEESQKSEHGTYHNKEFGGIVPKDRPEVLELLDFLKDEKFVIDCIDNNGQRKLVGTPDEPLSLETGHDTKPDVSGRNEYKIVFKGEGVNKSPFYML